MGNVWIGKATLNRGTLEAGKLRNNEAINQLPSSFPFSRICENGYGWTACNQTFCLHNETNSEQRRDGWHLNFHIIDLMRKPAHVFRVVDDYSDEEDHLTLSKQGARVGDLLISLTVGSTEHITMVSYVRADLNTGLRLGRVIENTIGFIYSVADEKAIKYYLRVCFY